MLRELIKGASIGVLALATACGNPEPGHTDEIRVPYKGVIPTDSYALRIRQIEPNKIIASVDRLMFGIIPGLEFVRKEALTDLADQYCGGYSNLQEHIWRGSKGNTDRTTAVSLTPTQPYCVDLIRIGLETKDPA
jgi:hypothetical protein